ncbi:MAG TPA: hypothetical protein VGM30_15260 [Puia sp.]|jgi:hypothetical protein
MKKLLSVLVLLSCLALPAMSQGGGGGKRQGGAIEAWKTAFITRRLDLSTEEAQRFWPIYNVYSAEVRQAYFNYRSNNNEIQLDESLLNIRKKYSIEFTKALSPGKVNDFFRAEKDFNTLVIKEQQRRQNMRRPFPGP